MYSAVKRVILDKKKKVYNLNFWFADPNILVYIHYCKNIQPNTLHNQYSLLHWHCPKCQCNRNSERREIKSVNVVAAALTTPAPVQSLPLQRCPDSGKSSHRDVDVLRDIVHLAPLTNCQSDSSITYSVHRWHQSVSVITVTITTLPPMQASVLQRWTWQQKSGLKTVSIRSVTVCMATMITCKWGGSDSDSVRRWQKSSRIKAATLTALTSALVSMIQWWHWQRWNGHKSVIAKSACVEVVGLTVVSLLQTCDSGASVTVDGEILTTC